MSEASANTLQSKPNVGVVPPVATGLESISRRRTLLKGVGKAGAIAGAAMPLRSLATGDKPGMRLVKNGLNYQCSTSGMNSATHASHAPTTVACRGNSTSYYKNLFNWPRSAANTPICTVGSMVYSPSTPFSTVFGGGSTKTLQALVQAASPGDEAHWVVAMLNATKMTSTFPYSTTEVKALYSNVAKRDPALAFFRDNLEV